MCLKFAEPAYLPELVARLHSVRIAIGSWSVGCWVDGLKRAWDGREKDVYR